MFYVLTFKYLFDIHKLNKQKNKVMVKITCKGRRKYRKRKRIKKSEVKEFVKLLILGIFASFIIIALTYAAISMFF